MSFFLPVDIFPNKTQEGLAETLSARRVSYILFILEMSASHQDFVEFALLVLQRKNLGVSRSKRGEKRNMRF